MFEKELTSTDKMNPETYIWKIVLNTYKQYIGQCFAHPVAKERVLH